MHCRTSEWVRLSQVVPLRGRRALCRRAVSLSDRLLRSTGLQQVHSTTRFTYKHYLVYCIRLSISQSTVRVVVWPTTIVQYYCTNSSHVMCSRINCSAVNVWRVRHWWHCWPFVILKQEPWEKDYAFMSKLVTSTSTSRPTILGVQVLPSTTRLPIATTTVHCTVMNLQSCTDFFIAPKVKTNSFGNESVFAYASSRNRSEAKWELLSETIVARRESLQDWLTYGMTNDVWRCRSILLDRNRTSDVTWRCREERRDYSIILRWRWVLGGFAVGPIATCDNRKRWRANDTGHQQGTLWYRGS